MTATVSEVRSVMFLTARRALLGGLIAVTATACGPQTRTLVYTPKDITLLAQLPPVAIYRLVDKRGEEERRIGTHVFRGRYTSSRELVYATEPVATTVTRAFADAVRARGFPVRDLTAMTFSASPPGSDAHVSVTGEVIRFWMESLATSGLFGTLRFRAECGLVLYAHDTATGRRFWERAYSHEDEDITRALAGTVSKAVNDPEFIQQLSQRPE
jgi:hypothetical protein